MKPWTAPHSRERGEVLFLFCREAAVNLTTFVYAYVYRLASKSRCCVDLVSLGPYFPKRRKRLVIPARSETYRLTLNRKLRLLGHLLQDPFRVSGEHPAPNPSRSKTTVFDCDRRIRVEQRPPW